MSKHYTIVLSLFLSAIGVNGQSYCSPTFLNGCALWNNHAISIGTIDWTIGASSCAVSDYTAQSTFVSAGETVPMTVTNGGWCGCAVWVDLDQSLSFEDEENLYYAYIGGSPSYTYNFTIEMPPGTPTGDYRMRVIGPWGSDGFTDTNINGYGPCGSFEYGNFNDFTLNVIGTTGVSELNEESRGSLSIVPNPVMEHMTLVNSSKYPFQRVAILSSDGRLVRKATFPFSVGTVQLDVSDLDPGLYLVQTMSGTNTLTTRMVKQ